MEVSIKTNASGLPITVVTMPAGRLNAANVKDIKRELNELIQSSPSNVLIDLSPVTFVDSMGLSLLVSAQSACQEQGYQLKICGLQAAARPVFDITGLSQLFNFYPTLEAALADFTAIGTDPV